MGEQRLAIAFEAGAADCRGGDAADEGDGVRRRATQCAGPRRAADIVMDDRGKPKGLRSWLTDRISMPLLAAAS